MATGLRLAVIIPVHNRRDLIPETLASIRTQTVPPWRVTVVDDGSTDGTAEAVEIWLKDHAMGCEIRVIRQKNAGVSAARNRGVEESQGADLLAFLDSDDLWPVDFVEHALRAFGREPQLVAATSDRMDADYGPGWKHEVVVPWPISGRSATRLLCRGMLAYPCATVYSAQMFRRAGGYREGLSYGEDFILAVVTSSFGPWGRIESLPAVRRQFLCGAERKVTHLSRALNPDVLARFAECLEEDVRRHVRARCVERVLAHKWRRAGKAMTCVGRLDEARRCYERAIRCRPWDLKARLKKLALLWKCSR